MAFESLAFRYCFEMHDFPERWLPLIHPYDPDLPLFPIYYFHVLYESADRTHRPADAERAFGYIEKISFSADNTAQVMVVINKDLTNPANRHYLGPVEMEVKERFGIINPVTPTDIPDAFIQPFDRSNRVLFEIWQRVVSNSYGNKLPFGRLWDETLGLTRFVASWYSEGGRKGELIQTHYFASKFGVRIQSSGQLPQVDFYLFPTIKELTDPNDPLVSFPQYSKLIDIAHRFQLNFCSTIIVDGITLSRFQNPFPGSFKTENILSILSGDSIPPDSRRLAIECFNAFNKGPQRTVIFLMLLDDLRQRRLDPSILTPSQCGSIYDALKRTATYQSPKAIQIYAQQSFGNSSAMPIDTWIDTFFKWPLNLWPTSKTKNKYNHIFRNSRNLGKVERLLWVAAQARKVHSSACNDALWCTKYGSNSKPRGANPFACNICLTAIRNCCPAFEKIKNETILFNPANLSPSGFTVRTSEGNNTTSSQRFLSCQGMSIYSEILDDFSPDDDPNGFALFPVANHDGSPMRVEEFVNRY